jgi:hypothetical protein
LRFFAVVLAIIIGLLSYFVVDKGFEAQDFDEIVTGLRFIIKIEKKIAKG